MSGSYPVLIYDFIVCVFLGECHQAKVWFYFSSHCQSETVLPTSQATAYIMSAADCHKRVRRGETCMKFSTNKAGDQFALLHKLCFPVAEMRSRNRSGQRKAGMLRLRPVNQSQGTTATIRLETKMSCMKGWFVKRFLL